jgi:hypothetical protein
VTARIARVPRFRRISKLKALEIRKLIRPPDHSRVGSVV